jgi:hypothetical protein
MRKGEVITIITTCTFQEVVEGAVGIGDEAADRAEVLIIRLGALTKTLHLWTHL